MPAQILLIYAKSTMELLNRQSALGSYIFCLCELLESEGKEVFVNGVSFSDLRSRAESTTNVLPLKRGAAGLVPAIVKEALKDLLLFRRIRKWGRELQQQRRYDCIIEFYNYGSDLGLRISDTQKIPLIVIYDSPVLEEHEFFHGKKILFRNEIVDREQNTLNRADRIVAYSNAVRRYLDKKAGRALNISIHQNVDFSRFSFLGKRQSTRPVRIGFIGSFLKWHRIDLLLEAFSLLVRDGYEVELYLVGKGMEYPVIRERLSVMPCRNAVHMPGFLDGSQLKELKEKLHIGVMPGSNWYGAPNKIFEYGAAGMAVVAPGTPTIQDLFEDKKEILLFSQDDAAELYRCLRSLCDDELLRNKLANDLQAKIRSKYSEKNTSTFYNQLINDVIGAKPDSTFRHV